MPQLTDEALTEDEGGGRSTWMTPQEYGASRAALWTGAVVLVTDTDGRVLVQSVDYRPDRLLPGGAVDAGEAPAAAAAREVREELGVDGRYPRGLAVDWIPADTPGIPPEMGFPGRSCTCTTAAPGRRTGSTGSASRPRRSPASTSPNRPTCPP